MQPIAWCFVIIANRLANVNTLRQIFSLSADAKGKTAREPAEKVPDDIDI